MTTPTGRLADKVAFVTGGASGLGLAIARRFAQEGARVVIADRAVEAGQAAARAIGDHDAGGPALFVELDVREEPGWARALAAAIEAFGRLDILVNNAGVATVGSIETTTLEEWRFVNAVNVEGVFLGCQSALPHLRAAGGGSIVNMSSVAGMGGTPTLIAYGASKAAVRMLTKSVALHCARKRDGVRCNSIHPVFISTPMVDAMVSVARDPEKARQGLADQVPLGRIGEADEVAAMALYLASDESRFVTGAEFVIDGGLTAS